MRGLCTTTKNSPCSPQLEKVREQWLRPSVTKINKFKKSYFQVSWEMRGGIHGRERAVPILSVFLLLQISSLVGQMKWVLYPEIWKQFQAVALWPGAETPLFLVKQNSKGFISREWSQWTIHGVKVRVKGINKDVEYLGLAAVRTHYCQFQLSVAV